MADPTYNYLDYDGLALYDEKIKQLIDGKVDKDGAKVLSTNDYTTDEKNKLAGITAGAEPNQNAFGTVVVAGTSLAADSKTDTLTITAGDNVTLTPTAASDSFVIAATDTTYPQATSTKGGVLTDAQAVKLNGIATGATKNTASTTTPKMNGTATVGTETAYAKGDHVHPTDTSRQETLVSGTNIKTINGESILGSGDISTPAPPSASSTTPSMDGTAAVGTATTYARADHVHPTDTSLVPKSSTKNGQTTQVTNDGTSVHLVSEKNSEYADAQIGRNGNASVSLYASTTGSHAELNVTPSGVSIDKLVTPTTSTMPTTKQYVDDGLAAKQDTLVSGTSIKTVNGTSILGSGDITTPVPPSPSSTAPKMDGTAAAGTATTYARADHVHPTDTSRAAASDLANYLPLAGGTMADNARIGLANGGTLYLGKENSAQIRITESAGEEYVDLYSKDTIRIVSPSISLSGGFNSTNAQHIDLKASSVTSTTPTAGDNSTKVATTAFVTTAVANAIAGIQGISYEVVATLPATGQAGVIYLVSNNGSAPNIYDEYIWTGTAFEKIGTTDVDLSGYQPLMTAVTNAQINALFA